MVLATAEPIESAERVLTRVGLVDCFDFVSGTELDLLRQDKPSVIVPGVEGPGLDPAAVDATHPVDSADEPRGVIRL